MRLESLAAEEAKGNGKKKGKMAKKGKNALNRRGGLNPAEKIAQTAYEQGRLSLEADNEIMGANLDDVREDRTVPLPQWEALTISCTALPSHAIRCYCWPLFCGDMR